MSHSDVITLPRVLGKVPEVVMNLPGLIKGDTVAVDMENRPEFPATLIGCAKLGVCAALINTSQKGKVLTHSFNLVKPKAAIIGQELVDVIQEVRDDLDLKQNFFYFADQDTLADAGWPSSTPRRRATWPSPTCSTSTIPWASRRSATRSSNTTRKPTSRCATTRAS